MTEKDDPPLLDPVSVLLMPITLPLARAMMRYSDTGELDELEKVLGDLADFGEELERLGAGKRE